MEQQEKKLLVTALTELHEIIMNVKEDILEEDERMYQDTPELIVQAEEEEIGMEEVEAQEQVEEGK